MVLDGRRNTAVPAFLAIIATGAAAAQPTTRPACPVSVDPRVELMSIICHLAGNPEYCQPRVKSYAADVGKHFGTFRNHAAVQMLRKLRRTRGVSYDAPMSLAVHLTDAKSLKLRAPLTPRPVGLDGRWRDEELQAFLAAARKFVKEAKFAEFLKAHGPLYRQAEAAMAETLATHGHLEWFDPFYGKRPGARFHLFLGMLNGGCCYGSRFVSGKQQDLYCILGVWLTDRQGRPRFDKTVVPTVVHEFAHSYVNPLVAKHAAKFEAPAKRMFAKTEKAMRRQAYANWHTMTHESIVRASVVRHRLAHEGALAAFGEVAEQHRRGFAWMRGLVERLALYEKQRDKYPTLDAFMPQIAAYFEQYAKTLPGAK